MSRKYYPCDHPTAEEVAAARAALSDLAFCIDMPVFESDGQIPILKRGGSRILGEIIGVEEVTVRSWWRGDRRMPQSRIEQVYAWIDRVAAGRERIPEVGASASA